MLLQAAAQRAAVGLVVCQHTMLQLGPELALLGHVHGQSAILHTRLTPLIITHCATGASFPAHDYDMNLSAGLQHLPTWGC